VAADPAAGTIYVTSSADNTVSAISPAGPVSGPIVSGYRADKCVADSGDSTANDTPVIIASCDGSPGQDWTVTSSGTLQVNGKCLDIYRDEKTNKAPVELWTCTGGANQQWKLP
jgi:DNA-binding beta-propeller fold protein YncE